MEIQQRFKRYSIDFIYNFNRFQEISIFSFKPLKTLVSTFNSFTERFGGRDLKGSCCQRYVILH